VKPSNGFTPGLRDASLMFMEEVKDARKEVDLLYHLAKRLAKVDLKHD
jgi:hypothetical protein